MKAPLKGFQKNPKDFPHKPQVKHTCTVMEPSVPIHTMVKRVDVESFIDDKSRTIDLPLEIKTVTSKLEYRKLSAETYDQNPEVVFTQTFDSNLRNKPQFRQYCSCCQKANHSVLNCLRKQNEYEGGKRNSYSRSKSRVKSFNQ